MGDTHPRRIVMAMQAHVVTPGAAPEGPGEPLPVPVDGATTVESPTDIDAIANDQRA